MMRIIRSRGYGKTYDLIKYALKNDVAIVVATEIQKCHHLDMAERCFGKQPNIYTIGEWTRYGKHQRDDRYVVDELELVARYLLNGNMVGYSMSM